MKQAPEISVVFDIGLLSHLALEEAAKMPFFKGQELYSEAVFTNDGYCALDGIKVTTKAPQSEGVL